MFIPDNVAVAATVDSGPLRHHGPSGPLGRPLVAVAAMFQAFIK
jgi:hypothetical protein